MGSIFGQIPGFEQRLTRILGHQSRWVALHVLLSQPEPDLARCESELDLQLDNAQYHAELNPGTSYEDNVTTTRIATARLQWEAFLDAHAQ